MANIKEILTGLYFHTNNLNERPHYKCIIHESATFLPAMIQESKISSTNLLNETFRKIHLTSKSLERGGQWSQNIINPFCIIS